MNSLEPFFFLSSEPLAKSINHDEMREIGADFRWRPRACGGELATKATQRLGDSHGSDCVIVSGFIKNPLDEGPSAAKRAKKETQQIDSVRLRHILVKYTETKQQQVALSAKGKPVTRTKDEAEALLRTTLADLLQDGDHAGDSAWAAKVTPRMLS